MNQQVPFYLRRLRDDFEARQARRSNYSLRSYARFLGVEAATLSSVLKGRRRLAKGSVETVAGKLDLSPTEFELFVKSNGSKETAAPVEEGTRFQLDPETHFRIISEWEHYAILSLMETKGFKPDSKWIASRLGVNDLRVRVCIENLFQAGLIRAEGKTLKPTHRDLATTEDVPSRALRKARTQDLEMALRSIDEIGVALRDLSACTMTMNPKDLQEMKQMIRDFRRRFMKRAESNPGTEVYKLSIQLIPLTKPGSEHETN